MRSVSSETKMPIIEKKENAQRASLPQPKPIALYGNNERNEADKSYAERKLHEIENLQVSDAPDRFERIRYPYYIVLSFIILQ